MQQTISISGALAPPDPAILQRARVFGRVSVSAALAGVLAGHAFGPGTRDDHAHLVALIGARIGAAGETRR